MVARPRFTGFHQSGADAHPASVRDDGQVGHVTASDADNVLAHSERDEPERRPLGSFGDQHSRLSALSAHSAGKHIAKPGGEGRRVVPCRGGKLQQAWHKSRDELAIALMSRPDQELISHMQLLAHRHVGPTRCRTQPQMVAITRFVTSVTIPLRVHSSAHHDEPVGFRAGTPIVRVTAPAIEGRANESLRRLLSRRADVIASSGR